MRTKQEKLLSDAIRMLSLIRKTLNVGLEELTVEDLKQVSSCAISAHKLVKQAMMHQEQWTRW